MAETKTEKSQRLNEDQLKKAADGQRDHVPMPQPDEPLPKGFTNPPAGQAGHRCLDPNGVYRPSWFSLLLHKSEGMPERQPFNCAGKKYSVRVGDWVDVPPEIIEVLRMSEHAMVAYDERQSGDLQSGPPRPREVGRRPRFNYNVYASA